MRFLFSTLICFVLLLPLQLSADSQLRGLAVDATRMPTSVEDAEGLAYWDELANTGTNFLRLQYSNIEVLEDESAYRAWMAEVLEHLAAVIPIAATYDMKVMFSLHSPPGGRDASGNRPIDRLFTPGYEWAQQVMVDFWTAAAAMFNANPTVAAYLIMGEPAPVERSQWKDLSALLSGVIRNADDTPVADQPAIVIPAIYGNPANASSINIPTDGGKYMASFNMYYPWNYTHQGLYDNNHISYPKESSDMYVRARDCGSIENRKKRRKCLRKQKKKEQKQKAKKKGKNSESNNESKGKPNPLTKEGLANAMKKIRRFASKQGIEVMVGEYSVVAYASGADQYLEDLTDLFDEYGFHSAYHIWKEAYVWSLQHTCTNKNNCTFNPDNPRMDVMQLFFSSN